MQEGGGGITSHGGMGIHLQLKVGRVERSKGGEEEWWIPEWEWGQCGLNG